MTRGRVPLPSEKKRSRKTLPPVVAEVCLYGHRSYAFLAARPNLQGAIVASGGWSADGARPSGELTTLTDCVHAAKQALQALGPEFARGWIVVFFPSGESCSITPIDAFETVAAMKLLAAPAIRVSIAQINRAAGELQREVKALDREIGGERVYVWEGNRRRGQWHAVAITPGENGLQIRQAYEARGHVAILGHASIGPPEGPPSEAHFEAAKRARQAS
ncbi:MAG: hypothetical protein K8H88_18585 [Sandaracinaceae bacterium]|nr:hypothetical protein [Sandaracinaceae bacterium]